MRGKIAVFTFTLIWALSLFSPVLGQGPPWQEKKGWEERGWRGRGRGPMPPPTMDWSSRLNLTEEQSARIQDLRESYLKDTLEWRNELMIKRFVLRDLLGNPQSDASAALAKQREISELESKIQERALLYHLEVRKILTPEQIRMLPPGLFGMYGPLMMPGRGMGREN